MSSKGDSLCLQKRVDLRLSNTKGRALCQGRLKVSTSFAILSFDYPISTFYKARKLEIINTMEMLQNQPDLTNTLYNFSFERSSFGCNGALTGFSKGGRFFLGVVYILLRLWLCSMGMLPPDEKHTNCY